METYEAVLKKAEKLMESFSDDFWKGMPTFSLARWQHRSEDNWRAIDRIVQNYRDVNGYSTGYYQLRKDIGKIWNRQRRATLKRTGHDKVLKQIEQNRIDKKKEVFDKYKTLSIETMRKLVSELVLYDHLLQQDQVNEKKAKNIQYLSGRFSWLQKEMIKAGRGTDRIKK
jgi:hypothetical protein